MNVDDLRLYFTNQVPDILQALIILLVGLLIAWVLSAVVRNLLVRFDVDRRVNSRLEPDSLSISNLVANIVFGVIAIFTVVAALDALNLGTISAPLNNFLNQVIGFIPNLIGGAILIAVAWIVATVVKRLIEAALRRTDWDERLNRQSAMEGRRVSLTDSLATLAYWLIWLLFLPGILDALNLNGLLAPVQNLVQQVVSFLPSLASAAIILLVGYFVARIVRDIVTNLLASTGIDSIGSRFGMGQDSGPTTPTVATTYTTPGAATSSTQATAESRFSNAARNVSLSSLIGTVVFALILIPVVITALDALNLDALSQPAIEMLDRVLAAIPNIFAAAILLAIAYFVARLIADIVRNILAGVGFDRILTRVGLRSTSNEVGGQQPSDIAATIIVIGIMLFAATEAARLLGFLALAALLSQFLVFFGNVLLGLFILGLGFFFANLADRTVRNSGVQNADILARVARYAILILTISMALRQMGIAEDLVVLAFGLGMGAIAVAFAIAVGLGGRPIAERELNKLVGDLRDRPQPPTIVTPSIPDDNPVPPTV